MITISSTDVQKNFGAFLDKGSKEIVVVKRQNREVGAFIPMSDLEKLRQAKAGELNDAASKLSEAGKSKGLTEEIFNGILTEVNPS